MLRAVHFCCCFINLIEINKPVKVRIVSSIQRKCKNFGVFVAAVTENENNHVKGL